MKNSVKTVRVRFPHAPDQILKIDRRGEVVFDSRLGHGWKDAKAHSHK